MALSLKWQPIRVRQHTCGLLKPLIDLVRACTILLSILAQVWRFLFAYAYNLAIGDWIKDPRNTTYDLFIQEIPCSASVDPWVEYKIVEENEIKNAEMPVEKSGKLVPKAWNYRTVRWRPWSRTRPPSTWTYRLWLGFISLGLHLADWDHFKTLAFKTNKTLFQ